MAGNSDKNVDLKWVAALKRRESALDQEERVRSICRPVIYRVHPYLRELKREHFDHSVISLGLFDLFDKRTQNMSDIPTRTGDALKLDVVIKFLTDVGETSDNWQRMSSEVVGEAEKMKMLYDGHWSYDLLEGNIRSSLALDAIFLTSFLEYKYYRNPQIKRRTDKIFWRADLRIRKVLFQDIFKLENQIPLTLIKNVLGIRCRCYRAVDSTATQFYKNPNDTLNEICRQILDFWRYSFPSFQLPKAGIKFYDCHHLLHCQAQILWNLTETKSKADSVRLTMPIENRQMQQREWLPDKYLPTAKELHQYGISFEGKDESDVNVRRTIETPNIDSNSKSFVLSSLVKDAMRVGMRLRLKAKSSYSASNLHVLKELFLKSLQSLKTRLSLNTLQSKLWDFVRSLVIAAFNF